MIGSVHSPASRSGVAAYPERHQARDFDVRSKPRHQENSQITHIDGSEMESLLKLLAKTSPGRIFLVNLYDNLTGTQSHLSASAFRASVWTPVRRRINGKTTPGSALVMLFGFLHDPGNRGLRFRRSPDPRHPPKYDIHTVTRPTSVLYDPKRRVLNYTQTQSRLGRHSETDSWTPKQARLLGLTLEDRNFRSGQNFAHSYDIFWATTDPKADTLDADSLRDALGLVHIDKGEGIILLRFSCYSPIHGHSQSPAHCSGPTVIEAVSHRRFKARVTSPAALGNGMATDLEELRNNRKIRDGLTELVLSSISMDKLANAKFVGFTYEHSDISRTAPTFLTIARDNRCYADLLARTTGLDKISDFLTKELEL
jgi:hypothetical protein